MRPEVILLVVGLLAIVLVGLSRRYGGRLLATTASLVQDVERPSKRQFFIGTLVVCVLVALYLGWHRYPNVSGLSELFANREGTYCFGGIDMGIGNEVEEFQEGLIPADRCMSATAHLEYPSSGYVQVVIVYRGTGRWAYYEPEGEIRTKPFPENNFGKPVEASWRWSNTADGFHERSGWLACRQVGKKFSCQGKLLTGDRAGDHTYEPVTFNEKPTRR